MIVFIGTETNIIIDDMFLVSLSNNHRRLVNVWLQNGNLSQGGTFRVSGRIRQRMERSRDENSSGMFF